MNTKILIIITLVILLVLIGLTTMFNINKKKGQSKVFPSPTPFIIIPTTDSGSLLAPTFTGVREVTPPKEIKDLTRQKADLIDKLPVNEAQFTITFDYTNGVFKVNLKDPKDQNRTAFTQWLQNNYPSIPLDRFVID